MAESEFEKGKRLAEEDALKAEQIKDAQASKARARKAGTGKGKAHKNLDKGKRNRPGR